MVINMELVFLNRKTFEVVDFGFVDTDYQIIIDNVVPQKSNFTVNKVGLKCEIGDLMIIKNSSFNYIGIVVSLEEDSDKSITKVQSNDFISILDIKVSLKSFSGDVALFLSNLITSAYINNTDPYQKISYLSISKDYNQVYGDLTFEADAIDSITNVVSMLNKAYSVGVYYNLKYEFGKISGIELKISPCTKGLILKSDFKGITNLVISNSGEQSINKISFIPSSKNTRYRYQIDYYLLTDGTITTNAYSSLRLTNVVSTSQVFKDDDYSALETKAKTELLSSSLKHSISFELEANNKVLVPFKDFNVGDFIEFITPNMTYQTMITQLSFKKNLEVICVTLGEYRISLTDKIKLLTKNR